MISIGQFWVLHHLHVVANMEPANRADLLSNIILGFCKMQRPIKSGSVDSGI